MRQNIVDPDYLFLNFLLNPARPIIPEPRRSMVAGSGTGLVVGNEADALRFVPPSKRIVPLNGEAPKL